jgi:transcriptional regulator with XRE-family HTH domain
MTQAELADSLGVSRRTIIRWQQGRTSPAAAELQHLADLVRHEEPALADELSALLEPGAAGSRSEPPRARESIPALAEEEPRQTTVPDEVLPVPLRHVFVGRPPEADPPATLSAPDVHAVASAPLASKPRAYASQAPATTLPRKYAVDAVVYAAAETADVPPRAMRPAVAAAFRRAAELGLTVESVLSGLAAAEP